MILPGSMRRILTALRGGVSPTLIFVCITLGFWFGLVPGWSGLHAILAVLVLVLNVPIGLFILSAGLGKALCFAVAPLLYHAGIWLHSYLSPLLRVFAAIPILGLTDFSRYSIAGAFVLGPVVGAVPGLLMARATISLRKMLLKFEDRSEAFRKWYSNRWVRVLDYILVSGRTKDARSLFTVKPKSIRKVGVVLALIVVALFAAVAAMLKDKTIKNYTAGAMTRANGAEVDLENLGISLLEGTVSASGIQVTDAQKPQNNQVTIDKIAADASVYDLLIGRLVMENVEVSGVRFDQQRQTPGKVIESDKRQKSPLFDPNPLKVDISDIHKLESYFKDAKALKEHLQKLSKYLPTGQRPAGQIPQKYLEYLAARADVPPSPRVLAKKIVLDKVEIPSSLFGNSRVVIKNVSDAVQAAALPVTFEMKSNDTGASLNVAIDYSKPDQKPTVSGTFGGIDLGKMQADLGGNAGLMFQSGDASGEFTGHVTAESVDLTMNVTIRNLQAKAQGNGILGLGAERTGQVMDVLKDLKTTIRIVGPLGEPRIVFDSKGLTQELKTALVKAGKEKLTEQIDKQLSERLGGKLGDKIPTELKDTVKKDLIKGLGDVLRKQDKKKNE